VVDEGMARQVEWMHVYRYIDFDSSSKKNLSKVKKINQKSVNVRDVNKRDRSYALRLPEMWVLCTG